MDNKPVSSWPTIEQLENELKREKYNRKYGVVLRSTIYTLIIVAAIAVLVATLWMPVLQIYGNSMAPNMDDGDIVVSVKAGSIEQGDVIAFYYNNKILIKRVIAVGGDWVNISDDGTVFVNGEQLQENYVSEKMLGECNIEMPYQVPESRFFVMGDNRLDSIDSRHSAVGCVAEEQIIGKLLFRVWPLNKVSIIK